MKVNGNGEGASLVVWQTQYRFPTEDRRKAKRQQCPLYMIVLDSVLVGPGGSIERKTGVATPAIQRVIRWALAQIEKGTDADSLVSLEGAQAALQVTETELERTKRALQVTEEKLTGAEERLSAARHAYAVAERQFQAKNAEAAELSQQLLAVRAELRGVSEAREKVGETCTALREQASAARAELQRLEAWGKAHRSAIAERDAELDHLRHELEWCSCTRGQACDVAPPVEPAKAEVEVVSCPECGGLNVRTEMRTQTFAYGGHKNIKAKVPVRVCLGCKFQFTDGEGEDARHAAVCNFLGVLSPAEIRAIRTALGYSTAELAHVLGFRAAKVAAWERGSEIQTSAEDEILRRLRTVQQE